MTCLVPADPIYTSGHFERASITISHMKLLNGPAKSMCNLCQGFSENSHGCKGTLGKMFLCSAQASQLRTIPSMSLSTAGHQVYRLAISIAFSFGLHQHELQKKQMSNGRRHYNTDVISMFQQTPIVDRKLMLARSVRF